MESLKSKQREANARKEMEAALKQQTVNKEEVMYVLYKNIDILLYIILIFSHL